MSQHHLLSLAILSALSLAQAQKVTIQYWHINTDSFGGPAVRSLIKDFEAKNPGIHVEERFQPNSYTGLLQNLQASLAANNPPDVAQVGYLYTNYVAENFPYQSVTALAQKYGGRATVTRFPTSSLKLGRVDGQQIGLPYSLSNIVTFYNADLLKKAGLNPDKPPKTWEDWRKAAQQIKAKTGKYGIYLQVLDDNWATEALMASAGGALLKCGAGRRYQAAYDSPQAAKALQLWADMVKEGSALNTLWNQGEQAFLAGESATFITTIAKRSALQANAKFDLRATPFPMVGNKTPRLPGGGNVLVVFSKDPVKQQAAWKFVQFLTSPAGFTAWTKGTGYVPPLNDLDEDPRYLKSFVDSNPIQRVGMSQLRNVIPWTAFPGKNGLAASQSLFKATQAALGGQQTAQQALKTSAQEVNGLLRGESCKR